MLTKQCTIFLAAEPMSSHTVVVFSASRDGTDPAFLQAAFDLGSRLAEESYTVLNGGGRSGLMRATIDGVKQKGGEPKALTCSAIAPLERYYTEAFTDENLTDHGEIATRKQAFCDLGDIFVALPGGLGTLEEVSDILSWSQLEFHSKHIVLVSISGFYQHLDLFIRHGVQTGVIREKALEAYTVVGSVEECLSVLKDKLSH